MHLLRLIVGNPLKSLKFLYTWTTTSFLVVLKCLLLPHYPVYQNLRTLLQRAYLSSTAVAFPDLVHRLPVGKLLDSEARYLMSPSGDFESYLIPGTKNAILRDLSSHDSLQNKCIVLYAHGGGYARGEAKMYLKYMNRWERVAMAADLDLVFLSIEYRQWHQES